MIESFYIPKELVEEWKEIKTLVQGKGYGAGLGRLIVKLLREHLKDQLKKGSGDAKNPDIGRKDKISI